MVDLTQHQKEALDWLIEYFLKYQRHASIRELAAHFGSEHNYVGGHVVSILHKKRYLKASGNRARGFYIMRDSQGREFRFGQIVDDQEGQDANGEEKETQTSQKRN